LSSLNARNFSYVKHGLDHSVECLNPVSHKAMLCQGLLANALDSHAFEQDKFTSLET